ncbi:uncharacterized protein [Thunnus thynnus]|uniref:uncharacterized protein isoform X1 n=1 Tax=Thunnus thynnus TaxID=8237 RepID=UPI003529242B
MENERRQLTPEQDALEHIVACRDKPFLEGRFIDLFKGRGVFTWETIEPSTFVVEYRGNIFSHKGRPQKKYGDSLNNYLFEFSWIGTHWCIDASTEDGTLGRLVNDDHISPNCEIKKIVYEGKPHLCLFAVKTISAGEEITYNYGDSSYPWRSRESYDELSSFNMDLYASPSTPKNETFQDSEASSFDESYFDDDDECVSGPSHDNDSFTNITSHLDFRDNSPFTESDSFKDLTASCSWQEDEVAFSSDELSWDGDDGPSEATRNPKFSTRNSKNYCYVCGKGVIKSARHLLTHADEEPEIAEAFALPKNSKERKKLLDDLRNKGNYKHNQDVLRNNSGELKLRRRPTSVLINAKTCMHCLYCKGMFQRKELWRHVARCPSKTTNSATGGKTRVLSEIALAESPFSEKLTSDVWEMLLTMKPDEVALAVQNDYLLLQLAQYLSEKYVYNPNKHDYIRQKLREMGRLLLALREKSIFTIEDAVKPENFYQVAEAVKDIAGFDEKMQCYKIPGLASKIGHSLKAIGTIVLAEAYGDEQMMQDTKKFMKLCAKQWTELFSQTAHASQSGQRVNNPSTIPFTHDVQLFYKYLETASATAIESLKMYESPQVYNALCRVTLAQASVLNKCAPEVSKMTLKTFQERDDTTQVLSKNFIRINLLGKSGQNIAVLLTSELVSAITLLVNKRDACGVHRDNPFLFARPNSSVTSHYHGRNCIRAFSSLCRAKNPEHLRSMQLYKHIARVFQILNLENDELDHLAKLLGHDIRADRDYYRLPEAAVELAKIAKLLLAMEKGSLERFKGNSLEEIEIEDELESDVEQGIPDNADAEEDNEESDCFPQQSDVVAQQGIQLTPEQDALEHIKACRDKPSLEERFIDPSKGRGVFTSESIAPSTFVVEYRGNIFPHTETRKKKCGDTLNSYFFDFSWNGTNWRIDASKEDGTLGRLVNEDHISPNCEMKKIVCEGKPHVCLFAVKKISAGEEITYNYGDSSHPWRSRESGEGLSRSQTDRNAAASSQGHERVEDSAACGSAESCSDGSFISNTNQMNNPDFTESDCYKEQSIVQQPTDASCVQQEDKGDDSPDGSDSDDDSTHSDASSQFEDPYCSSNRNFCYVCGESKTKIARHLYTHRDEEADIAAVFALPRNSKERKRLLYELRNRGNYKHNQEVLQSHSGQLKVRRKASMFNTDKKVFAVCLYCKGTYVRKVMWRHLQKCPSKKCMKSPLGVRAKISTMVAVAESTDSQELSSDLSSILNKLKKDDIASVVQSDFHILQIAQYLLRNTESKAKNYTYIQQRVRELGRLLLTLKTKSIFSFEEAIKPQNFSKLLEAVREVTGFNEEMNSFERPTVFQKLGVSLKNIGDLNLARALKEDADKQTIHEAEAFVKLCAEEWVSTSPSKPKINSPSTVPFIQDVQLFYQCMEKTASSGVGSLTMYESPQVYNALLRVTVAQVSVLNKNALEVSKVTLKSFKKWDETEPHDNAAVCQSQLEQILTKGSMKINVTSNGGKKVAVMLTPELLSAIKLLVSKRESCGVHENNPFLFGRPVATYMSFYQGHQCVRTFTDRCKAKKPEHLRSAYFRKYITRVFQILSLTNDELDQLAKLLGCDIRTDKDYYQSPEAAVDIAKISVLLSATENGSLEKFQGKSLEEIEIPDKLEPEVEQDNPKNSDAEDDNEESESSLQLSARSSSKRSFSAPKTPPSRACRVSSSKKRGPRKSTKREKVSSGLNKEKSDEVNAEKDDRSEEMSPSCAVNTREETPSRSNDKASNVCFSDDDEDMNVDFDMDIDTDEDTVRNVDNDGDGDTNSPAATPVRTDVKVTRKRDKHSSDNKKKGNKHTPDIYLEDTMDTDTLNNKEKEDQKKGGEENNWMDVDRRDSSAILNTGKKKKLLAALTGTKEVKILIPKLDIEKLQVPVHMSQLPSLCHSFKSPLKDLPIYDEDNTHASYTKAMQMTCSHCKKNMILGQKAYQKKGFTDVFCSKSCLLEMFPVVKTVTKTCHYCLKAISQLLDLIMAAVDINGTMKDFCSQACLSSFKSNPASTRTPQSICSKCNKFCTSTCELTLDEAVHKFCSDACLESFCRDNMVVCENCSCYCHKKPLVLKMEEGTKTICSENCLNEFKEKIKTPHRCTMCHTSRPVSDMVDYKSSEDTVELFCTRTCATSYKLRPAIVYKLQGKKGKSGRLKKWRRGRRPNAKSNTEGVQVVSDSAANQNDTSPAAASETLPTLIIADSCVVCCHCGKKLPRGQTLYQPRSSLEVFCSASCLSVRHPHIKLVTKNCYNCCQVIMRPHNVILAPVDDSGTMKELCSETCLASVKIKRNMAAPKPPPLEGPRSECRMCARFCFCKYKLTVDGVLHRVCSDACFISYHKVNNLPLLTCDICSSVCLDKRLMLKTEDGGKTICSGECLVKFKEKVETPQLCIMCQTSHRISDMVENKNDEGKLDFFCSNRCMMVYKAQAFTVAGRKSPSYTENDIKEVKPLVPNLDFIKEEPIDEEYNQNLPSSVSTDDIKDEPNMSKEGLKIGSVFSLMGDSTSTAPTFTHMDLPASCSSCKKVLMDGETVYQRKSHTDIFCSTSCLLQFYQMKPVKKTCYFCLQAIMKPRDILHAPVDNEGTMKDFCSQTCFSSFNYKRIMSTKIPIVPLGSRSQCSMCGRYCISKHEIIQQDTVHKICSEPCFLRFCNLSICKNCNARCNTPLRLKMDDGSKILCGAECLAQFKQGIKTPQTCSMCHISCLVSDMVENKNSEDVVELFCTSSCLMASKIQAVSASGAALSCGNCGRTTVPACHLAMSDASVKNFCTLTCAMAFKETQKDVNVVTNPAGAPDQTQGDSIKPPEKLPCAQCRRIIKTAPKVVQKKGKMNFVCSPTCSHEFKRVNNIIGECEYCKTEKIIGEAQRVDNKDCYFCSDGCKMLFQHNLEKKWGKHCRSCAYCLSISKSVVTAQYENKTVEFCSEDCNLNYKMLHCRVASCDTCGRKRKLKQSLSMLGEVKHFCDMKCLLLFCNKKGQMVNTVSSPPGSAGAAESSPVIANVISLAGALKGQHSTSTSTSHRDSVSDIQTKVVGHVSIQTVPKELKNKSMLCTPLVHNKGVSCSTQTVDAEAQTDNFVPKVIVLPVPVPVYVPVPMNMYSQYTPKPVGLPLPLPVPMFLPVTPDNSESIIKSMKERIPPDGFEGELNFKAKLNERNERGDEQKDEDVIKEGESQDTHAHKDHTSSCSDALDTFINQEVCSSFTRLRSLSRPHAHKKPPLVLDVGTSSELPPPAPPPLAVEMKEGPQCSLSLVPAPPLLQETVGKVHNKNKGRKLQQLSKTHKEETSQRDFSKATFNQPRKLSSQYGIDAWKRWIQWRESQTNLDLVSLHNTVLKEDVLCCSAAELSDGLCRFITEVKRPDGEPYSPDSLFYLCLSIQQHLFNNGRMENIFSDLIYSKFLTVFTKILKDFKPSITASSHIHFRIEEEFLWDCKQLGAYSPVILLNTLLFFCCKYFGFTTVEQHRQLSFAHVMRCTKTNKNNTKTTFLRFYPPVSINEAESDGVPAKKRRKNEEEILQMKENTENPLRCPVRLYEFYISKCSKSARRTSDLFYLQPDRHCVPNSPLWFSSEPLDDRTMEAMLVRILTIRELWREDRGGMDQQTSDDPPFIPDEEDSE